ncbi:nuclear pore complex protein Nup155 [Fistulifera solaris]|uniref:Nuclear pore complex protein Nup155 n=1 Tax=Fistulifera solaris TaxID=1519565 RepID=A0A1Z5K023_FISSO|nr:nuclear pore complex protein Nup155 [Fistulifera solaris]|eukprot:GAX19428.1 nuclear pore complex protein Nup155 [Fistulifera solaris]
MASTQGQFAAQLADFWKDDFAPLEAAGRAVLNCLREDEAASDADLYRRIANSSTGSHAYFEDDDSKIALQWKHVQSDPLPVLLSQQLSTVQSHSLMGLLAPASLAWMSVDHKLYLWSFQRNVPNESLLCFEIPSQQCVVSVGLVQPKKGVFKDDVKWGIVVTTPEEIFFCALVHCNPSNPDFSGVAWRLVPTSFTLPTDGVRILSIAGTQSGRIFLGGDDGCVYEMSYEGRIPDKKQSSARDLEIYLDRFYENGEKLPNVVITDAEDRVLQENKAEPLSFGKRAWSAISGDDEAYEKQPRKVRKLNRTSDSFLRAILPDFISNQAAALFGGKNATGGGGIVQIAVDEERQTLYTLGVKGWICAFDLRSQSSSGDIRLASVMDTVKTSRLYLEAVSRGQVIPPNTLHSSVLGTLVFPGGSQAAQSGVGGMDGARNILKIAISPADRSSASSCVGENVLKPVSIQVVAPSESSRVTLVAITQGGLRLYISSLAPSVFNHGTASALQSNGMVRTMSNILAPHTRLTFCHMRAPPMKNSEKGVLDTSSPVEGAILPRYSSPLKINAAWYEKGNFVAAVEGNYSASKGRMDENPSNNQKRGDIIVATSPDASRHLATLSRLSGENGTKENSDDKERFLSVGGISEAVSFPMSMALGIRDRDSVTPGGAIWQIASLQEGRSPLFELLVNSMTPSESELGIGPPPAFYPSSRTGKTGNDTNQSNHNSSTDLVDLKLSSAALSVVGSVLGKLLLARPISMNGMPAQIASTSTGENAISRGKHDCYRISSRDASNGFSSTAEERSGAVSNIAYTAGSQSPLRSARLRQGLLKPPATSLNLFSTQHLDHRPREIVAVNAGGLHYFQLEGHLHQLANAILSARERVRDDATVTRFFSGFGYKEGCAMCITLAIGCVEVSNADLRRLAMDAAFARALAPRLIPSEEFNTKNSSSRSVVTTGTSDPIVPKGFEFKPSALCESLYSTLSRLVRPVWNKPVVVVTEGPFIKRQWSKIALQAPAKVEILLNETTLEEISRPLRNLQCEVRSRLFRAVASIPGSAQPNSMEIDAMDGWSDDSQYLTRALQYHNQSRTIQNGTVTSLSVEEAESIARLIEEKNIHSLYRLLSRVVQLLNLLFLLRRAQISTELHEVDWGMLHGFTFWQLVGTLEGQDRLESMLNALVTYSASDDSGTKSLTAQADDLVDKLGDQCYLFFSPGSRLAYSGLRKAAQALNCHPESALRRELKQAAKFKFKQAAQHWRSATLVTGHAIHTKEKESYKVIAQRAIQYGSPLAMAVAKLIQLEDVDTAVDVCLSVASNFRRIGGGRETTGFELQSIASQPTDKLSWEHYLYHKRPDQVETGVSQSTSSKGSRHSAAYGTDVSSEDVVATCYALIFYHLSFLLKSPHQLLARSMLEVCSSSTDSKFLEAFYSYMLESGNEDILLRIVSTDLEEWLRKKEDQDLLWRYLSIQGRQLEAGQELFLRGCAKDLKLPLSTRIEYLSKALSALRIAMKDAHGMGEIGHKVDEVDESLQVARIQSQILQAIESSTSDWRSEISEEKIDALKFSLVNVSDLYNDYAVALELYECCLQIRHICRHDDPDATRFLWKHIICKEFLPCATRSDEICQFLKGWVAEIGRDAEVVPISIVNNGSGSNFCVFENGDWIKQVEDKVVDLGQQLYGKGRDYVAPPKLLLSYLDELCGALPDILRPEWPLIILARIGVPYLSILDTFETLNRYEIHGFVREQDDERWKREMHAIIELLRHWVASARSAAKDSKAWQELFRSLTSGKLMPKIDDLRIQLETHSNTAALQESIRVIAHEIQSIA